MPGGGGSAPAEQRTVTTTELSPEQKKILGIISPQLEQVANTPIQYPSQSTVAPFSPETISSQQQAIQTAQGAPVQDLIGQAIAGNTALTQGQQFTPEGNPYLARAIEGAVDPIFDRLEQSTLPGIRSDARLAGNYGSSRQGIAEGLAIGGASEDALQASSRIAENAFLGGLDAQTKALALAPQTFNLAFGPSSIEGAVGYQKEALDSALRAEGFQESLFEQTEMLNRIADIAGIAFGIPGGSTVSTGTGVQPQGPGRGASALATGTSFASIAALAGASNPAIGGALAGGALLGAIFG